MRVTQIISKELCVDIGWEKRTVNTTKLMG